LQEFKEEKREGSVISTQTVDSLSVDEKQVWRTIRKELEGISITVAAFDANEALILEWFTNAVTNGAFEVQVAEPGDDLLEGRRSESRSGRAAASGNTQRPPPFPSNSKSTLFRSAPVPRMNNPQSIYRRVNTAPRLEELRKLMQEGSIDY
jgi:hypothetical protein